MKIGDRLEVTIEKPVYRGRGLARHEGRVVLVPRGAPGERLRVRVDAVHSGYATAVAEEVVTPAATRRLPPCPAFARCGGCAHQDLDYPAQLRMKEAVLRDALARAGVPWESELPVHASPEEGWRTRAFFHVEWAGDVPNVGLHEEGSHRVVDLARCLQLSEGMNRTQRALARAMGAEPAWRGRISGVELAESGDGARIVAALETGLSPAQAISLAALGHELPWLSGLCAQTRQAHNPRFLLLQGSPFVEHDVDGLVLRAHVRSFFQANRFLVGDLVRRVVGLLGEGGDVLDLYAGVGLFALAAAPGARAVRAVELNPQAVEDASFNARRAGFGQVTFRQGDVAAGLRAWPPPAGGERIILDPPRTGAGKEVARALAERRPQAIVYVSCDPPTLGRDLAVFRSLGYRADVVEALDLFPDTFHLETVARLVPDSLPVTVR